MCVHCRMLETNGTIRYEVKTGTSFEIYGNPQFEFWISKNNIGYRKIIMDTHKFIHGYLKLHVRTLKIDFWIFNIKNADMDINK